MNHLAASHTVPVWTLLWLVVIPILAITVATPARAAGVLSYSLTTQNDPVAQGHVLEFDATVTNLTGTSQSLVLNFIVPQFTTYNGLGEGTPASYNFGSILGGQSETAKLRFVVNGSGNVPPDGTVIQLTVTDTARAVSVLRSAVVQSSAALTLKLSSEQGTVAPAGNFTYTLATANVSGISLAGTTLSATVPAGASFVSADGGGTLNGQTITWNFGTVPVAANVQVHATFQASSSPNTPVGPLEAVVSDSGGHVARASDTRVVYSAPAFSYVLTATPDPVMPGHVLEFDATVINLAAVAQSVVVDFTVPEYTTYNGLGAGSPASYNFGSVAAGSSETAKLRFVVLGSGTIPPDGTTINLNAIDLSRGASISRSAVVRAAPAVSLQLSSEQATVAPGSNFTYTFATANVSRGNLPDTTLSAAVPADATFVSADGGGVMSGGIVTWSLGTLRLGANVQVHATFQASSSANTPLGPLDAVVSDSAGHVAQASDVRVVYSAPAFSYVLTATPDPVMPGHVLEFDATVTNRAAVAQSVTLDFTVPEYTTYNGLGAGSPASYNFGSVAAGTSETAKLRFVVLGSGTIPPDGTTINLNAIDISRGASISRSAVVRAAPAVTLQLSSEQGSVTPGGNFTYTLAAARVSSGKSSGTILSAAVPAGATFVSADGGGVLAEGLVTWNLGTLRTATNMQVHATFQASTSANTPLGPLDAMVSDSAGNIARASDTRVVYSAPAFSYVLTATPDPAMPGHVLEFDATVTNLAAVAQSVVLDFTVPDYTTYNGLGAGSPASYNFGSVAAGSSETARLRFVVLGSGTIPPEGTTITLNAIDLSRGASISRSAVVRAVPTFTLQLSSGQGTVAPGSNFTYTLATANVSGLSVSGTTLTANVPAGATFVSADHGGKLRRGVLTWNLGTLAGNTNVQVSATYKAASSTKVLGPFDASVTDKAAHVARASDTRVIYTSPVFTYGITAMPDPVAPGEAVEYDVTVTNNTAVSQSVIVDFTVPEYTTYNGLGAGSPASFNFGSVGAGASETAQLFFNVLGSGNIPPDGTSITLDPIDLSRGASVSRTVVVDSSAP